MRLIRYLIAICVFLLFIDVSYGQHDKCGTMHMDSVLRTKIPNAPTLSDFEDWLQRQITRDAVNRHSRGRMVYTIPVVVHVIHNGDPVGSNENISQAQVISQIETLNEDFRRLNADTVNTPAAFRPLAADIEIEFCLAQIDPNGNIMPEPGIDRVNAGQSCWSGVPPGTIWDPTKYCNLWTVNFCSGSLLGFAQFPEGSGLAGMPAGSQNAATDGCVMRYTAFGRVGNVNNPYNLGRTTTHEIGHWLGLRHIWGDGGCGTDDFCNDTPVSDAANNGCNPNHVSCGTTDMVQNYMDYTNDGCMNLFTEDQKTRMLSVLLNSPRRVELLSSTVCQVLDQYQVTGQVRNSQTLQGVPFARVRLSNTGFNYEVTADLNGNFTFNSVFEGTYNTYGGDWGYITTEVVNVVVQANMNPVIIDLDPGYYDDFIFDFNWTVSGNAQTGIWERAVPLITTYNGATSNPGQDVPNDYGEECYVTGNGGGTAGNDDVDNGNTILTSPIFDLTGYNEAFISYYRWFYNDGGNGSPDDQMEVRLSNGNTTVTIELLDAGASSSQWNFHQIRVRDFITPTANMRLVVETADDLTPNGHLVEAGLDLFRVVDSVVNQHVPPVAAFNSSLTNGCSGSVIDFADASFNSPTAWNWSFPGGTPSFSTLQNPSVTYNTPGAFDVSLVVSNTFGSDTLTLSALILINDIDADFTANITSGCPGLSVQFTDLSNCNPTGWNWNFPGGTPVSSNLENPVVVYESAGIFDVTLTVTNSSGGSGTLTGNNFVQVTLGSSISVLSENFESNSFSTNGWTLDNPDADMGWEIVTVAGNIPGDKAARVNLFNYNATGQRDGLISPVIDLSSVANTVLTFEHAHRRVSSNIRDSLIIYVSVDGGANFTSRVFAGAEDGTGTFATGFTTGANFVPANADDWCHSGGIGATCFTVDLSTYDGLPLVALKFETYNNNGNNIYLDNIEIYGTCTSPSQPPIANFSANVTSGCGNLTVSFFDQSVNGASSWNWSFPGGSPSGSTLKDPLVSYASPGMYDVILTATSPFGSDSIIRTGFVTLFESPISQASVQHVDCFGGSNGMISVMTSGGASPYNYIWSTGAASTAINSLSAGSYSLTVQDENGCSDINNIVIIEPQELSFSLVATSEYCGNSNGTVEMNVVGGTPPYSYHWSTGETDSVITNLTAGSYTVTVSDFNGCDKAGSVLVNAVNSVPVSTFSVQNVTCFGGNDGSASVSATGGVSPYMFSWSTGDTTQVIDGLTAGNYVVTVADDKGCSVSGSVGLYEAAEIILNGNVTDATCGDFNGQVSVISTGGIPPYSYIWNSGDTLNSVDDLQSGSYVVTVTDGEGCQQTGIYNISNIGGPVITFSKVNVSCAGGTDGSVHVLISGGTQPYSVNWSTGDTLTAISGLAAGNYSVTVIDANNCHTIGAVAIGQPLALDISFAMTDAACGQSNGKALAIVAGGNDPYTFNWSNGGTDSIITGVLSGTYLLSVTDANGCQKTSTAVIGNAPGPMVTINVVSPSCFGYNDGAANALVTGGAPPYLFDWSNGSAVQIASNLLAGSYSLTVTDDNGCAQVKTANLSQPSAITVTPMVTDASCGNNDGAINVSVSGGNAPYQYFWSTGSPVSSISGLSSGSYELTITDNRNCYSTTAIIVSNLGGPGLMLTLADVTCYGGSDGFIGVSISGGSAPYIFNWSNGESSQNIGMTPAGNYVITVTDNNGCKTIESATVTEPSQVELIVEAEDLICNDKIAGVAVETSGGYPPYIYSWSNGESVAFNSVFAPGTYYVTVTDSNGCLVIDSATVNLITSPELVSTSTPDTSGSGLGTAAVNVSAGAPPYTYQWNDPDSQRNFMATGLFAGVYTVTVTDSNGCEKLDTVTVGLILGLKKFASHHNLLIYPNPGAGIFIVEAMGVVNNIMEFQVFNTVGQVILHQVGVDTKFIIDLTNFAAGVYLVRLKTQEGVITRKVIYSDSN